MCDISAPALEKAIAKVKEIVPNAAGKLETTICDVSKESDVAATVERVDAWGGLDVMFNNAGIMHADDAGMFFSAFSPTFPIILPISQQEKLTCRRCH